LSLEGVEALAPLLPVEVLMEEMEEELQVVGEVDLVLEVEETQQVAVAVAPFLGPLVLVAMVTGPVATVAAAAVAAVGGAAAAAGMAVAAVAAPVILFLLL
jgi:hypothetical protein